MGSCPFLSDFTHSAHPRWKRRSIATACAAPSLLFFHQLKRESDYAECLDVDQRGLRSVARAMRHGIGGPDEVHKGVISKIEIAKRGFGGSSKGK